MSSDQIELQMSSPPLIIEPLLKQNCHTRREFLLCPRWRLPIRVCIKADSDLTKKSFMGRLVVVAAFCAASISQNVV